MSANLENKKAVVEEIKSKIQNAKAVVFVGFPNFFTSGIINSSFLSSKSQTSQ